MAVLPAVGYTEDEDGPAENTGEQIDETADKLRDGAADGIEAAREALKKTGEAVDERAEKAREAMNDEGD
ncbi:MAG: hypothetical protein WD382_01065 [Halofilum sp. (in: g-proteobacteria)]